MQHLAPGYIYTPQGLQRDMLISISDDGRIASITDRSVGEQSIKPADISALPGVALLPGFVNVHSHVFQRALCGHTHRSPEKSGTSRWGRQHHDQSGPFEIHPVDLRLPPRQDSFGQDTFWTWRHAMYAEAQRLNPDSLYESALRTYREMLAAGYTSVGEFHYLHHRPGGQPYANPNAMAEAILQAGREAGIRVVLLMTAYAQSGFDSPAEEEQRRFCDVSVEAYLERVDALRIAGVPIGVAPHSVRAVPEHWFRVITDYSRTYDLSLHMHADEQVAEIEQCQAAYGCRPIELLERYDALGPLTTIVHATHANDAEIALLARHSCTVCVCPTTEGDLGDGIAPYEALLQARIPLSIGSDSNTRLDPIEELRWAEYTARMRYQRRRILVTDENASPGPLLLAYGTRLGAAALRLETGVIAPGLPADFVAVDLHHPSLAGWTEEDFLDVLFFGASSEVITQTWVQGKEVL